VVGPPNAGTGTAHCPTTDRLATPLPLCLLQHNTHAQHTHARAAPLPDSLIYFDVSNNSMVGQLPDFSGAKDLTLFDVSRNQLTGSLPASFGPAGNKLVRFGGAACAVSGMRQQQGPVLPRKACTALCPCLCAAVVRWSCGATPPAV
jgi:hypothetical protein